jgi:hypothetical protein
MDLESRNLYLYARRSSCGYRSAEWVSAHYPRRSITRDFEQSGNFMCSALYIALVGTCSSVAALTLDAISCIDCLSASLGWCVPQKMLFSERIGSLKSHHGAEPSYQERTTTGRKTLCFRATTVTVSVHRAPEICSLLSFPFVFQNLVYQITYLSNSRISHSRHDICHAPKCRIRIGFSVLGYGN